MRATHSAAAGYRPPLMHKPHTRWSSNRVDWSDPHLESLLKKSEDWKIDSRGTYTPQGVQIHIGWGASTGKHATLVWEHDQAMVLVTDFPLPQGEHVRVDKHLGESVRSVWGVVVEGREGYRTEDRESGAYVHWVHVR
ncbi:hypothetical protein [Dyella subtropica]|uniref:hypothetical protein n=1 Tax=Dyella subtropica TaxID=2992127 RepID=UPI00224D3836|nr:hypothetical protein [Dyella subtropica]